MKISLSFLIIGLLFLIACSPQPSSPPVNEEPTPPPITEPEPEPEPQEVTEPLEYQCLGWGFGGYENLDGNYVFGPHYKLMNRDEVAGHFTIRLVLYTVGKDEYLDLVWEYPHGLPEEVIESKFEKLVIEEVLYLEPRETGEAAWSWEELSIDPAKIEYDGRWEILPDEVTKLIEQ